MTAVVSSTVNYDQRNGKSIRVVTRNVHEGIGWPLYFYISTKQIFTEESQYAGTTCASLARVPEYSQRALGRREYTRHPIWRELSAPCNVRLTLCSIEPLIFCSTHNSVPLMFNTQTNLVEKQTSELWQHFLRALALLETSDRPK